MSQLLTCSSLFFSHLLQAVFLSPSLLSSTIFCLGFYSHPVVLVLDRSPISPTLSLAGPSLHCSVRTVTAVYTIVVVWCWIHTGSAWTGTGAGIWTRSQVGTGTGISFGWSWTIQGCPKVCVPTFTGTGLGTSSWCFSENVLSYLRSLLSWSHDVGGEWFCGLPSPWNGLIFSSDISMKEQLVLPTPVSCNHLVTCVLQSPASL